MKRFLRGLGAALMGIGGVLTVVLLIVTPTILKSGDMPVWGGILCVALFLAAFAGVFAVGRWLRKAGGRTGSAAGEELLEEAEPDPPTPPPEPARKSEPREQVVQKDEPMTAEQMKEAFCRHCQDEEALRHLTFGPDSVRSDFLPGGIPYLERTRDGWTLTRSYDDMRVPQGRVYGLKEEEAMERLARLIQQLLREKQPRPENARRSYTLSDFIEDKKLQEDGRDPCDAPPGMYVSHSLGRYGIDDAQTLYVLREDVMEYASTAVSMYSILRADYDRLLEAGRVSAKDQRTCLIFARLLLAAHVQDMIPPQGSFSGPGPKPSFSREEALAEIKRVRRVSNSCFAHTNPGAYTGDRDDELLLFGSREDLWSGGHPYDGFDAICYLYGTYYLHRVTTDRTAAEEDYFPFPFDLLDGDGCVTFEALARYCQRLAPSAERLENCAAAAGIYAVEHGWTRKEVRYWESTDRVRLLRPWERTEFTLSDTGTRVWFQSDARRYCLPISGATFRADAAKGILPEKLYEKEFREQDAAPLAQDS